jgi:transposase-like protein
MPAPRKYSQELRERSVRLVSEAMAEDPSLSLNQAVIRIGERVGVVTDTLRGWTKQKQIDEGVRKGTTTSDAARIKELQAEVRELKRANEILLAAFAGGFGLAGSGLAWVGIIGEDSLTAGILNSVGAFGWNVGIAGTVLDATMGIASADTWSQCSRNNGIPDWRS